LSLYANFTQLIDRIFAILARAITLQVVKWCSLATLLNFLWFCGSPIKFAACKRGGWRRMMPASHMRPVLDWEVASARQKLIVAGSGNAKLTICSGTDCKL
jgi:hypothetical protein